MKIIATIDFPNAPSLDELCRLLDRIGALVEVAPSELYLDEGPTTVGEDVIAKALQAVSMTTHRDVYTAAMNLVVSRDLLQPAVQNLLNRRNQQQQ
jgi:hypothetical protein